MKASCSTAIRVGRGRLALFLAGAVAFRGRGRGGDRVARSADRAARSGALPRHRPAVACRPGIPRSANACSSSAWSCSAVAPLASGCR